MDSLAVWCREEWFRLSLACAVLLIPDGPLDITTVAYRTPAVCPRHLPFTHLDHELPMETKLLLAHCINQPWDRFVELAGDLDVLRAKAYDIRFSKYNVPCKLDDFVLYMDQNPCQCTPHFVDNMAAPLVVGEELIQPAFTYEHCDCARLSSLGRTTQNWDEHPADYETLIGIAKLAFIMFGPNATGFYIERGKDIHFVPPINDVATLNINELQDYMRNKETYGRMEAAYYEFDDQSKIGIDVDIFSKKYELYKALKKYPRGIFNVCDAAKLELALFWCAFDLKVRATLNFPMWTAGYAYGQINHVLMALLLSRLFQTISSADSSSHDGHWCIFLLRLMIEIQKIMDPRKIDFTRHVNGKSTLRLRDGWKVKILIFGLFNSGHIVTYIWNSIIMMLIGWYSSWRHHGFEYYHGPRGYLPLIRNDVLASGDDTIFLGPSCDWVYYYAQAGFKLTFGFSNTFTMEWLSKIFTVTSDGVASFRLLGKLINRVLYQVNNEVTTVHDWARFMGKLACYLHDAEGVPIAQAFMRCVAQAVLSRLRIHVLADVYKAMEKQVSKGTKYVLKAKGYQDMRQVETYLTQVFNFHTAHFSKAVDPELRIIVEQVYGFSPEMQLGFEESIRYMHPSANWPYGAIRVPHSFAWMMKRMQEDM